MSKAHVTVDRMGSGGGSVALGKVHAALDRLEKAAPPAHHLHLGGGGAGAAAEKSHLHLRGGTSSGSLTSAAQRSARLALLSMVMLILQGTALSIALRYSRVKAGTPYLGSVSVLLTEARPGLPPERPAPPLLAR